jgi:hypothetical protein
MMGEAAQLAISNQRQDQQGRILSSLRRRSSWALG